MRWRGRRGSANMEDRRGRRGVAVGGGIGVIVVAVIVALLGGDPGVVLEQAGPGTGPGTGPGFEGGAPPSPEEQELAEFVSVVLADTEEVWSKLFAEAGRTYREPTLVLFAGSVQSACGIAGAAVGPFYCPSDHKAYLDLSFFEALSRRLGAPGDFAQAYVIAHEIGHHIQNLMGTLDEVARARAAMSTEDANRLMVRLELQADFLAGVWAHHAARMGVLEPGDIEEALHAASAIGDDRLQQQSQGYVVPDSFTHGTSEQRVRWFRRGYESGDPADGDTFATDDL